MTFIYNSSVFSNSKSIHRFREVHEYPFVFAGPISSDLSPQESPWEEKKLSDGLLQRQIVYKSYWLHESRIAIDQKICIVNARCSRTRWVTRWVSTSQHGVICETATPGYTWAAHLWRPKSPATTKLMLFSKTPRCLWLLFCRNYWLTTSAIHNRRPQKPLTDRNTV